jgi:hypothetical protein
VGHAGAAAVSATTTQVLVTGYFQDSIDLGTGALTGQGSYDAPLVAVTP